ncbi:MAG: PdxA family dehydrogenase [Prevotella sp.]|jgi:4-hydroxythreonine-4-phosphate dehydrogenase
MEDRKIRVAITHGDTNGIGYELIFKAFDSPEMLELCTPIIYGSPKLATYHRKALGIQANFSIINSAKEAEDGRVNMLSVFDDEVKVDLGVPTEESSRAAVKALDRAITDYRDGLFDVLVTAPVDKDHMHLDGFDFTNDHFVEMCVGEGKKGLCILMNQNLRMALLTDEVALRDVAAAVTKENVEDRVRLFSNTLARDFRISEPRVAVFSLNPSDREEKHGQEETEAIIPAIGQLAEEGYNVFGPYHPDEFFKEGYYTAFDGILAMHHDQGYAPFLALEPEDNVDYLAGLPLICASADMGPSYDIAGTGKADVTAFRHAIYCAIDAYRNRRNYDEAGEHPLPKLYHERKDDSEKVRFSIPKKHENSQKDKRS